MFGGGSNPSGGIMSDIRFIDITRSWDLFLDDIARIESECYGPIAWTRTQLVEGLQKSTVALAAWVDGVVVATLFVEKDDSLYDGLYIWSLATDPAYQKRGIASSLMDLLISLDGLKPIRLMVKTQNAAAIRLYERCGFVYEASQPHAYVDGSDGMYMIRPADKMYDPRNSQNDFRKRFGID